MHVIKKAYAGQKVKKERRQKKQCLIGQIVIESHSFLDKLTELLNPRAGPIVESFSANNNVQNIYNDSKLYIRFIDFINNK